ncbi:uncharacterized protein [Epargyreus clarus]|uniref:uncharacterized protein n=1 Tax=Epargyreus clarus TaxID=520877 RepID=UPI003C2D9900
MCGSSKLGYFIGNLIYIIEKLASCCAVTAVVTCLITTLMLMLAFGIGIGYNYCFVDFKTRQDAPPDRVTYTTTPPTIPIINSPPEIFSDKTTIKTTKDDFVLPPIKRKSSILRRKMKDTHVTASLMPVKRTVVVPLDVGVDLSSLLSKIRALNKNVTLEIVAP